MLCKWAEWFRLNGERMSAALCSSPGSCSSGRRRKEGSAVFVVFWPFPVSNIKPPHTLTVRQTLWVRAGGQTDLCVFVCVTPPPPLMDQMAGQESRECLQSCMLKRSREQGIICLRLSLSSATLTLFCIIDTVAWSFFFFERNPGHAFFFFSNNWSLPASNGRYLEFIKWESLDCAEFKRIIIIS